MGFADGQGLDNRFHRQPLRHDLAQQQGQQRADPPGNHAARNRGGQNVGQNNVALNHAQPFAPPRLVRQNARLHFQPALRPVRESQDARQAELGERQAGRFGAIANADRPPVRAVPDHTVRTAIRTALRAGQQRENISQTYLASKAYFGEAFAKKLNDVRHLISTDQFDAAQFPELSDLLGNNHLFHATGQALYEATAAPTDAQRIEKLQSLTDTLVAFNFQVQELPPRYTAWVSTVTNAIHDLTSLHETLAANRPFVPEADKTARDPVVRGVLVQSEINHRSQTPPRDLSNLQRDLGQAYARALHEAGLLLKASQKSGLPSREAQSLAVSLKHYQTGKISDAGLAEGLAALRERVANAPGYTARQKQALSFRLESVAAGLRTGQTPSAQSAARVAWAVTDNLRTPADTQERAIVARNFARTSVVIPPSDNHHEIVPREATARLVALDQIHKDPQNLLPTTLPASLPDLFNEAHADDGKRVALGAALETLKSDVVTSTLLSGRKAAILSLIEQVQRDVDAHFERDAVLDTHAPGDVTAWLDDHGHAVDARKIEALQNTLDLVGIPKALQINFVSSLSQYLSPDTDTQTQSAYALLKQDGAELLRGIEGAAVDADIKAYAQDAFKSVVTDVVATKPSPQRSYTAYRARGGDEITPNVLSPGQRPTFDHWAAVVTAETGIERNPLRTPKPGDARKVAEVWTRHLSDLNEDFREDYGRYRSDLARDGQYGVSIVLQQNALVCRELSVVASALFAEFGIQTQVGAGNVLANTERPGGHAWLEVLDDSNQVSLIVDSNFKRATFDSFSHYEQACSGVTYRRDGGQQRLVQVTPSDLYHDIKQTAGLR